MKHRTRLKGLRLYKVLLKRADRHRLKRAVRIQDERRIGQRPHYDPWEWD